MNQHFLRLLALLLLTPLLAHSFQTGGDEKNPFIIYYDDNIAVPPSGQPLDFEVIFQIPPEFYLYADKMAVTVKGSKGLKAGTLVKPEAVLKEDPYLGKTVPVYYNEVHLTLPLTAQAALQGGEKISGDIQFQGCSTELCYRLMRVPFQAAYKGHAPRAAGAKEANPSHNPASQTSLLSLIHASDFTDIQAHGMGTSLLISFLAGILTSLTPCVWPMIPVTLTIIGVRKDQSALNNLKFVFVLILGMAVMYATLGISAAFLGKGLGFVFQSLFFLIMLEAVLLAMAASLLGLYEISIPACLQDKIARASTVGYSGVFIVGLTMGLLAAPCVGPIVGPLLVYVAQTQSLKLGFILLSVYALGIGTLFLILGGAYGAFHSRIRSGRWMLILKKGLGVAMLAVAFYYGQIIYGELGTKGNASITAQFATLEAGLNQAQKETKPVIIDFFAQWCPPCHKLDREVWSAPFIQKRFHDAWIFIKIDCTNHNAACEEAIDRYKVIGWPTVIFLDKRQNEIVDSRLVGKVVTASEMNLIMDRISR